MTVKQRTVLKYSSYLKNRFGCKVYRIGIDAGLGCPNRDGTKGQGGCLYCNARGSGAPYIQPGQTVRSQIANRIEFLRRTKGAEKFIAYFQAFSNTYAPVERLRTIYDEAAAFSEIVGLSIGTRPDTIDRQKCTLISGYAKNFDVWLELGLQTANDATLAALNRGHTARDFTDAVRLAHEFGIPVAAHVILGLPGESIEDMLATARALSEVAIDGVKLHSFHILRGSAAEELYKEGKIRLQSQDEYADHAALFLESLPEKTVVFRLTAAGTREDHIAPEWALDKAGTIKKIYERMIR